MKSTFRVLFYLKRDKQKADGTVPLWCRVTIDGEASRFNTKSDIHPDIWDAKAARACGKTKTAAEVKQLNQINRDTDHTTSFCRCYMLANFLDRPNRCSVRSIPNSCKTSPDIHSIRR